MTVFRNVTRFCRAVECHEIRKLCCSLLECLWMKSSGHCFESVYRSWTRAHKMIVIDLVDTTLQAPRAIVEELR